MSRHTYLGNKIFKCKKIITIKVKIVGTYRDQRLGLNWVTEKTTQDSGQMSNICMYVMITRSFVLSKPHICLVFFSYNCLLSSNKKNLKQFQRASSFWNEANTWTSSSYSSTHSPYGVSQTSLPFGLFKKKKKKTMK